MKKEEFATQIAGTLGDFSIANQYSVETINMEEPLGQNFGG